MNTTTLTNDELLVAVCELRGEPYEWICARGDSHMGMGSGMTREQAAELGRQYGYPDVRPNVPHGRHYLDNLMAAYALEDEIIDSTDESVTVIESGVFPRSGDAPLYGVEIATVFGGETIAQAHNADSKAQAIARMYLAYKHQQPK